VRRHGGQRLRTHANTDTTGPQIAAKGAFAANVPDVLRLVEKADIDCPLEVDEASYFLSKIELGVGDAPGMARWRKRLFVATPDIAADAAEYFGLPRDRTVIMGSHIEV
jgi:KUP system potassium uptake protein